MQRTRGLFNNQTEYLGCVITAQEVKPETKKVTVLRVCTCTREVSYECVVITEDLYQASPR